MNAPTDKQVEFAINISRELVDLGHYGEGFTHADAEETIRVMAKTMDRKQFSEGIDRLIAVRNEVRTAARAKTTEVDQDGESLEGMHKIGDRIFKVQVAVHGSGNLYAKELVRDGDRWTFEYARGAMRSLSASSKMSLAEAKEFGALYGTCCVCGRTLTNETSIEEGIGPVCGGRFDR